MTPLDAAITRIQKGFSPVPVPHRSKRPVLKEWQRLEITTEVASQYFNGASQNIGVLLGDKFGSADVDCDCPEAITAARELLPETGLIFGRQSKPLSHFFYRSDPPARTAQFIDPLDQSTIVELRGLSSDGSVGLQTVVPPSVHETGEPIRFEQCGLELVYARDHLVHGFLLKQVLHSLPPRLILSVSASRITAVLARNYGMPDFPSPANFGAG